MWPCPVPKERPLTSFAIAGTQQDLGWSPEIGTEQGMAHLAVLQTECFISDDCIAVMPPTYKGQSFFKNQLISNSCLLLGWWFF